MMDERETDILVVGGGLGGVAGALAAARLGQRVILTDETDWIDGQLSSQAVPPDEPPWIEATGCTASYRRLREGIRDYYRSHSRCCPVHVPIRASTRARAGSVPSATSRASPSPCSKRCSRPIARIGWPAIDYWLGPIVGVAEEEQQRNLSRARQLSLSMHYWMQTESPRLDGGRGTAVFGFAASAARPGTSPASRTCSRARLDSSWPGPSSASRRGDASASHRGGTRRAASDAS